MQCRRPCAAYDVDFSSVRMQHSNDAGDATVVVIDPREAWRCGKRDGEITLLPSEIFDDRDAVGDTAINVDITDFERRSRSAVECEVEGE